jgi:membrane associated rhomboid family serine protease
VSIPATVWLGIWFLEQWLNGVSVLHQHGATGGVAYWAHVGGFLFGAVVALPMRLSSAGKMVPGRRPYYHGYDQEWPFA